MQSNLFEQHFLITSLSIVILLANSGCGEQARLDANGIPYTTESIHALIDDLGKYDVNTRNQPQVTVLSDKRLAAIQTLGDLGNSTMPLIIERLSQIPELEQALMQQSDSKEQQLKLNWLLSRKADLIVLVGESGNKEHGKLLLSLADTKVGTGKIRAAGLVLALRKLGAATEEQIMLDRLFKSPDAYVTGSGALLSYLLVMRNDKDKALATRVASWPLESRIKGRAVILGARLGVREPILSEIKTVLQRSNMPSEIRNESYEVGLYLTALAELLPPDEYLVATADQVLLQHKGYRSVVRSAQQHNQFWWASVEEKDQLVQQLARSDKCDNDVLALHHMLKNERIDLLLKTGQVFDSNVLERQSQPKIEPYYEIGQVAQHRIALTGYKLSAADGKVMIEKTPGYGMFD